MPINFGRRLLRGLFLLALLPLGVAVAVTPAPAPPTPQPSPTPVREPDLTNNLGNPPNAVDRLMTMEGDEFSGGEFRNVEIFRPLGHLSLMHPTGKGFPTRGRWVSPELVPGFAFSDAIPSWNVQCPEDTGVTFELRVRDEDTTWSPWLYMGQWGRTIHWPARTLSFPDGEVNVDTLLLSKPQTRAQLRVQFFSFRLTSENGDTSDSLTERTVPGVSRLTLLVSGTSDDPEVQRAHGPLRGPAEWSGTVPVPFFAQGRNASEIAGSTCCPTSTAMVMTARGCRIPAQETALAVYDPEYGIFGTWTRAVAFASERGVPGYITRVRSWAAAARYLSRGQPIIASIRFRKGEFPSNPMGSTNGHLIVVRGIASDGRIVVNDPAHTEEGEAILYDPQELAHAWFDKGGVAIILQER